MNRRSRQAAEKVVTDALKDWKAAKRSGSVITTSRKAKEYWSAVEALRDFKSVGG